MTSLDHHPQTPVSEARRRVSPRAGGIAGLLFFVLYFVSGSILAGAFGQTESLEDVQRIFAEQADTIDIACALLLLGTPLVLAFALALRDVLGALGDRPVGALILPAAVGFVGLTLASAALMGGASFLAESATVDGATAAFAHSVSEALLFYGHVLLGTLALSVAAASAGRLPRWYRITATALGTGMVVGSAASPVVRDLALLAGLSTYLFLIVSAVMLVRRGGHLRPS